MFGVRLRSQDAATRSQGRTPHEVIAHEITWPVKSCKLIAVGFWLPVCGPVILMPVWPDHDGHHHSTAWHRRRKKSEMLVNVPVGEKSGSPLRWAF